MFACPTRNRLSLADSLLAGQSATRVTALAQGSSQLKIDGGTFNIVGGDSHTHIHNHSAPVDLESYFRSIPNFRKIYQDTIAKATPGTGMWLLKNDKFMIWLEPNGDIKIFWGSGIRAWCSALYVHSLNPSTSGRWKDDHRVSCCLLFSVPYAKMILTYRPVLLSLSCSKPYREILGTEFAWPSCSFDTAITRSPLEMSLKSSSIKHWSAIPTVALLWRRSTPAMCKNAPFPQKPSFWAFCINFQGK
jgi:hypothetical protein